MSSPKDTTPDAEDVPDGGNFGALSAAFWALVVFAGLGLFVWDFGIVVVEHVPNAAPRITINNLRSTLAVLSILGGGGTVAIIGIALWNYEASRRDEPKKMNPGAGQYTVTMYTVGVAFLMVMTIIMGGSALYQTDEAPQPTQQVATERTLGMTIHGGQWFWRFKVGGVPFSQGNHVVLPADTVIKFRITSADVIHSFAVQELGVKKDAVPGQMNDGWFMVKAVTTKPASPGQERTLTVNGTTIHADAYQVNCAELCGKGHSQMVAEIYIVSVEDYKTWVGANGGSLPESFETGEQGERGG